MKTDLTELVERAARARHEQMRAAGDYPMPLPEWEQLPSGARAFVLEDVLPLVQVVLEAIGDEPTPDPVAQAAEVIEGAASEAHHAQLHADVARMRAECLAFLAVLRVTGAVVVGEDQLQDARSGTWGVWAVPDPANRSVEFSARQR